MADSDFISASLSFDFAVGSTPGDTFCINISITDDSVGEENETFTVILTAGGIANITVGSTLVTITDDDDGRYMIALNNITYCSTRLEAVCSFLSLFGIIALYGAWTPFQLSDAQN